MSESSLYGRLKRNLPLVHWQKVEPYAEGGVPDVNACYDGVEWWLELKVVRGWKAGLRPSQIGWIYKRSKLGGRVFILVQKNTLLYLYEGAQVRELAKEGLQKVKPVWMDQGLINYGRLLDTCMYLKLHHTSTS